MSELIRQLQAARRCSTPIVAIETSDPGETLALIEKQLNGPTKPVPLIRWDCAIGAAGMNELGHSALAQMGDKEDFFSVNALLTISREKLMPKGVVCFVNIHRFMNEPVTMQAIWNLRDKFKANGRMAILLAPRFTLPEELRHDVVVLRQPMPDEETLAPVVADVFESGRAAHKLMPVPTDDQKRRVLDGLRGLTRGEAEQAAYMSLTPQGIDTELLWKFKRSAIGQIKGLSYVEPEFGFDDIGGCESLKLYIRQMMKGRAPFRVCVLLDEIDKSVLSGGGSGSGDENQINADVRQRVLTTMQNEKIGGWMEIGPPGCSKSFLIQCVAKEFQIPVIELDFGALKGQYVGQSEGAIREALETILTLAGKGGAVFAATCNRIETISSEIRRRFTSGVYYFDLPDESEKDSIWNIHLKRVGLPLDSERPIDSNWTGSDIRNCVDRAWELDVSLIDASRRVVPVYRSNPKAIDDLREAVRGKFLSASYDGFYQGQENPNAAVPVNRAARMLSH